MKITYTAPNRSHHYPYAESLHRAGHLHRFVCGFSRLSPRATSAELGNKLKRRDFYQTLMVMSGRVGAPQGLTSYLTRKSDVHLDGASYREAVASDIFLFYRTQGYRTTQRLKREGAATRCVMEEVNSHIRVGETILREEYEKLELDEPFYHSHDYDLRLRTYEAADYILCPSEFVRESFLSQGFAADRLLKVNFGFKTFDHQLGEKQKDDTFRVLYVGQLHFRKGLRYALRAFGKLRHPNKEFVIVGPKTKVTGLERESIPDHVTFTGTLKGNELIEAYRSASLFVLPSLEEGLALVQGEALSFGIPLLITTNTGGADLITDGEEGFIVEPGDADALRERMQQLADDPYLLQEMATKALRETAKLGSWDVAAAKLIAQFERINEKGIG